MRCVQGKFSLAGHRGMKLDLGFMIKSEYTHCERHNTTNKQKATHTLLKSSPVGWGGSYFQIKYLANMDGKVELLEM